jgi:hypothetical protein
MGGKTSKPVINAYYEQEWKTSFMIFLKNKRVYKRYYETELHQICFAIRYRYHDDEFECYGQLLQRSTELPFCCQICRYFTPLNKFKKYLDAIENTNEHNVIRAFEKNKYIHIKITDMLNVLLHPVRQNYMERAIAKLCLTMLHDYFQTMTHAQLHQITTWSHIDKILFEPYLFAHIANFF